MPYLNLKLCGETSQETASLAAKCLTELTDRNFEKEAGAYGSRC